MQYISRQPGLPVLSYATCVRVAPTLGYNLLLAAHLNFLYHDHHQLFIAVTVKLQLQLQYSEQNTDS